MYPDPMLPYPSDPNAYCKTSDTLVPIGARINEGPNILKYGSSIKIRRCIEVYQVILSCTKIY